MTYKAYFILLLLFSATLEIESSSAAEEESGEIAYLGQVSHFAAESDYIVLGTFDQYGDTFEYDEIESPLARHNLNFNISTILKGDISEGNSIEIFIPNSLISFAGMQISREDIFELNEDRILDELNYIYFVYSFYQTQYEAGNITDQDMAVIRDEFANLSRSLSEKEPTTRSFMSTPDHSEIAAHSIIISPDTEYLLFLKSNIVDSEEVYELVTENSIFNKLESIYIESIISE